MAIVIAEYLGVRSDSDNVIHPYKINKNADGSGKLDLPCPFRNSHCDKARRGNKPVCSLRDTRTNELWIVCSHRLCATSPKISDLNSHQQDVLHQVAKVIFDNNISKEDVLVKREVSIAVTESSNYSCDYVMRRKDSLATSPVILEMQGGGETTNTGVITRHVTNWEEMEPATNQYLATPVSGASPLVTNAWRRQQEQFLVKGNVAMQTGGRLVFCIGSMLYKYLMQRFRPGILSDLRNANWTLALLSVVEDHDCTQGPDCAPSSIPLKIDHEQTVFTNYNTFVQVLTNQATYSDSVFVGEFSNLNNEKENVS